MGFFNPKSEMVFAALADPVQRNPGIGAMAVHAPFTPPAFAVVRTRIGGYLEHDQQHQREPSSRLAWLRARHSLQR